MKFSLTMLKALVFCVIGWGSNSFAETISLTGAGATFPFPLYSKWFSEFQKAHSNVQVNYQSIGSGGGIRQFSEGTLDFGATDSPMTDEQISKLTKPALHIPTVLGAVVVTYNLEGVGSGLKLKGSMVADIFLGKITQWNDPRIREINPSMKLPDLPIMVVHRSDGSGTTGIFTDYLAKVSPSWKEKVGQGTAVNWPAGLGGKGNEGVTGLVKQTPGSIGYVELIYAENNKLAYASLENKSGAFVVPSMKSVTAAATASLKSMPEDFRISITDSAGKEAYPISGFTYLLVYKSQEGAKGKSLVQMLKWCVTEGQTFATDLFYAPLPKEMIGKVNNAITSIKL